MRSLIHIILLAAADYRRERLLSLCSVLGLTAVLAPLLILYGVKFGVMTTLSERMLSDPNTTEITPVSSGRYTKADMDAFRTLPGVAFVLPRTRSIAATMNLALTRDGKTARTTVSLEPTAAGDPVLVRYKMDNVTMVARPQDSAGAAAPSAPKTPAFALAKVPDVASPALREAGCILSDTAAGRLQAEKGDLLLGTVERAKNGLISRAYVRLRVIGILPVAAQQKPMSYVPLELLEAVEDFRDHRAVPELGAENGWTGEARPTEARQYAGFRLYADSLGRVTFLRSHFAARGIETYTHAEEIEQIQMLETGLTLIFTLICSTAAVGFFLSTSSSVFAGIKRKERTL
ncbi:MAG: ABC transporter permease, partial [Desulfovibrionaceae bacterium]|nr:ABC transporter permease [Desulfovibrionaceae bacterium]